MIFTGNAELTIDAKQRLAIPSKWRALLKPERDGAAWYCVPGQKKKLVLYTETRFIELTDQRGGSLTQGEDEQILDADLFGLSDRLEMDSAGRITLSRQALDLSKIGTDVVMIGAGRKLEVWNKQDWAAGLQERFANLPNLVKRIEERRTPPKSL